MVRDTQEELLKTPISFKCGPKGCNVKPDPMLEGLTDVNTGFVTTID